MYPHPQANCYHRIFPVTSISKSLDYVSKNDDAQASKLKNKNYETSSESTKEITIVSSATNVSTTPPLIDSMSVSSEVQSESKHIVGSPSSSENTTGRRASDSESSPSTLPERCLHISSFFIGLTLSGQPAYALNTYIEVGR